MQQLLSHRSLFFSSLAGLMLASCAHQPDAKLAVQPSASITATPNNASALDTTSDKTKTPQAQPATQATAGHGLSPAQVEKLTKLPIPIVVPTYLPPGFRVTSADGASAKLVNGDDDSGYSIAYESDDGTCFAINSSQDSPRRLKQVGQVESAIGTVKMYEETYEGRSSVQSFIPVKGNPVMISPFLKLNPATANHAPCKALDRAEYERVLQSIAILK